jgi:hypothetical protein
MCIENREPVVRAAGLTQEQSAIRIAAAQGGEDAVATHQVAAA